jgi:hypothetical protein
MMTQDYGMVLLQWLITFPVFFKELSAGPEQ